MRHTRLARWQWFAVVSAAAGMLALLVFLIQVGLSEAVAISTVLSLFVAIAAVLVAGAVCLEAGRRFRADNKDSRQDQEGGQGVGASGTRYPQGNAGAAGTVGWGNRMLGIALVTFSSDSLLKYSASWPWWVAAAAAFVGFVADSSGIRADLTMAAILGFNTLWFFSYSVIIVEYRQTSSSGSIGQLATLSWLARPLTRCS